MMIWIAFLLSIVIVPGVTVALSRSHRFGEWLERLMRTKQSDEIVDEVEADEAAIEHPRAEELFRQVMSLLQTEVVFMPKDENASDDDVNATFEYQGGHFVTVFRNGATDPFDNSLSISYFSCFTLPAAYVARAGELANLVNNLMLPVKCSYSTDVEAGNMNFSLHSTGIRLAGCDDATVAFMRSLLLSFFRLQRMLHERFETIKVESPSETESNRLIMGHQLYALNRMEFTDQQTPYADPLWNAMDLTIGGFVNDIFGVAVDADMVLRIDGHQVTDNPAVISNTPLLESVVTGSGQDAKVISESVVVELRSMVHDGREIVISMRAERIDDRLITVRVNAMMAALPITPYRAPASMESMATSRTVIIGVPCVTPEAFLAEAKYMADELGLVTKCKDPDAAQALYWGKLLYTEGRFIEAEHYLVNAYSVMRTLMEYPENLQVPTVETFYEVCYYLGVVNCALGRYHSAYYYLDLIVNQHRVLWTEQYVACLMAIRDPRCPSMVAGLLESIRKQRDEAEEIDDETASQLNAFIGFLERQQIIMDIRTGKTDRALDSLTKLIADDPDSAFALYWLKQLS